MKKMVFLLCALAVLAFTAVSCNDNGVNTSEAPQESNPLAGTSWVLVEFVDVENGENRKPDYNVVGWDGDSDTLYQLSFVDDTLAIGNKTVNGFSGKYLACYTNNLLMFQLRTTLKCCDTDDGELYYTVLNGILFDGMLHFTLYPQELHIFYNNGKEYLKFKKTGGWDNEY